MERYDIFIGKCLLIGALICVGAVSIGGLFYLIQHGSEAVPLFIYPSKQSLLLTTIRDVFSAVLKLYALGIIQLGLFMLLMVQLLRVVLTTWFFIKLRDKIFICFSVFIFIILFLSTFMEF
ncbi:MAG: DUF1634 domain-containing protein [Gammaproteobacteria bacterium]